MEQLQNHDETGEDLVTQPPSDRSLLTPRIIKAEANLLRLPLFALDTKGLRTLDAIECRGNLTRDDVVHEFVFRASRNATTPYPGPLARSAHLAFLSLMAAPESDHLGMARSVPSDEDQLFGADGPAP